MNHLHFTGRLAKAPTLTGNGDKAYAKFTLIRNEYAGKGQAGDQLEKQVSIQFTAFRRKAEAIAEYCRKGDQLTILARVENNNYQKDGVDHFDFSFVVDEFEFGAPGAEKRSELASRRHADAQV